MSESVTRYVVTHIGTKGMRMLTLGQQGRYTYATSEEAEEVMDAILNGENNNDIPGVYGEQSLGTFEVRPVPCYPGHFDPKTRWFD